MDSAAERKRRLYARIAGSTFLIYIVAGVAEASLFGYALGSGPSSARLASVSARAELVQLSAALSVVTIICALVLAVALFAITRDYDLELAVLALCGRAAEGAIGALYVVAALGMLAVADVREPIDNTMALFAMLTRMRDGAMNISATCFAVGSTLFSYLFLRAGSIPAPLAWLGLAASLLLVVTLPFQLAVGADPTATWLPWLPMLVFELIFAVWLITKGVAPASSGRPLQTFRK
jgi:hypothetical protein